MHTTEARRNEHTSNDFYFSNHWTKEPEGEAQLIRMVVYFEELANGDYVRAGTEVSTENYYAAYIDSDGVTLAIEEEWPSLDDALEALEDQLFNNDDDLPSPNWKAPQKLST
jgi:hypothetical protein